MSLYKLFNVTQKNIESAKQQLASLTNITTEKQSALLTLMNLTQIGYSEHDIKELLKHINDGRRTTQSGIWVDN